jgi:hypothetical protein
MIKATVKLSGGAIKDEKQAGWVLFGLALAMLALSFYLFFSRNVSINKLPTNYTPNPDMSHVSS